MEKYRTKEDVLKKGLEMKGRTLGEIDVKGFLDSSSHRGSLGHMVEESHFDYRINPGKGPDFAEAGVELKVTPVVENKNGTHSAKERLVLNVIDFEKEWRREFEASDFWKKNESLLLVFYLFKKDTDKKDMEVVDVKLYEYPEEDLEIIKDDWKKIMDKIRRGLAHELSESDTMYLGACPKGRSSKDRSCQPFSTKEAMRRAYSLKSSYMTQFVRAHVFGEEKNERVISSPEDIRARSFEEMLHERLRPYMGRYRDDLIMKFGIKSRAKNLNEIILARMLGVQGRISKTEEFQKANIVPKTIRIEKDGRIVESMSFKTFKFTEIIKEDWETSELREFFETTRFMFVLFQKDEEGRQYFQGIHFWNMPLNDLETHMKKVWEETVRVVKNGEIVRRITTKGRRMTNFPTARDNPVGHVRPHARNRDDSYPLPVPDKVTGLQEFTKQCFWLNNHYVRKILDAREE